MDVIPDVDSVAAGDHVPQSVLVSASRGQLVADRLVPLPPGAKGLADHGVLVGGGRSGKSGQSNRLSSLAYLSGNFQS